MQPWYRCSRQKQIFLLVWFVFRSDCSSSITPGQRWLHMRSRGLRRWLWTSALRSKASCTAVTLTCPWEKWASEALFWTTCRYRNHTSVRALDEKTWRRGRLVLFVPSGGLRGPRLPAGASAAGSLPVASGPRRGNAAHTPAALDGPEAQFRVFSKRTQLLGQVTTRWRERWDQSVLALLS